MWCFGKVNGKLAEVFFEKKNGKSLPWAHCLVKKEEYKTKKEQRWIKEDTKRVKLSFKNKKYTRID